MTEAWIAQGCAEAARLRAAGYPDQAAEVLRYVERRGLGCHWCGGRIDRPRSRYCSNNCRHRETARLTMPLDAPARSPRRWMGCQARGCPRGPKISRMCWVHWGKISRSAAKTISGEIGLYPQEQAACTRVRIEA